MSKKRCLEGALACVGAVIGAGFVSGREVVTFFTRYGGHSWWLILLAAVAMTLLCALCMRRATEMRFDRWCLLYENQAKSRRLLAEGSVCLLLTIIGGAMLSAAGHMTALLWPSEWAYPVGVLGTLYMSWGMGRRGMRPLSWFSSALGALFLGGVLLLLNRDGGNAVVSAAPAPDGPSLVRAALWAVGYASMNLVIAIGVVCKTRQSVCRRNDRQSAAFGFCLVALLFLSNYLYLRHPELWGETFPVVWLFRGFGRVGFTLSVVMLYLAVFTTLIAILYALDKAAEGRVLSLPLRALLVMGAPLCLSMVGFQGIVDGLYAPVGLLCLLSVFLPLARRGKIPS